MKLKFTILLAVLLSMAMVVNDQVNSHDQDTPLTPMEELGKNLFFDKISDPGNMACAACHAPDVGFTGPQVGINKRGGVYRGAVRSRFGNRKPPSAAYATFSPVFHFDESEGLFFGGNFWDGRATGEHLGNPAADQALGPFLNPVEQNNPDKLAVLEEIAASNYSDLWETVWGAPLSFSTPAEIDMNYDRVGLAIAGYEASSEVNPFSSKYDYYLQGLVELTELELWGLELFNGQGMCNACHPSAPGPNGEPPLFTDFSFDNLGVPKNPENPFYDMDEEYLDDGSPINPLGDDWVDLGLGGFLASHPNPDWAAMADENMGKHKVPTLRNVSKRNGNGFTKAYTHNGYFKSLKDVTHFYNTRDILEWPAPEVAENVNSEELGNLGLTDAEEDAIVAFMGTLSDGYELPDESARRIAVAESKWKMETWPNPGRGYIHIEYRLAEPAEVLLEVYNVAGKLVTTVVNNSMPDGLYRTGFDGSTLPTGIYIVRMKAGRNEITRKVMIVQ